MRQIIPTKLKAPANDFPAGALAYLGHGACPHVSNPNTLQTMNILLYNGYIIKKEKCSNTPPCNCSTVRVAVVYVIYLSENHPFACDGVGWFSCILERSSERNGLLTHAQSLSSLHE
jgi:hypothetical protein